MKKLVLLTALLGFVPVSAVETTHAEAISDYSGGEGLYVGSGVLLQNGGEKVNYYEPSGFKNEQSNGYPTHIGGTFLVGLQRVLPSQPVCFGLEIGTDMAPRHEELSADKVAVQTGRVYTLKTTRSGFSPFAAIRVGYIDHEHKWMGYFRVGVSRAESKMIYDEFQPAAGGGLDYEWSSENSGSTKLSSWMPTLAVGLERSMAKDITSRVELEYRFPKTKKKVFSNNKGSIDFNQRGILAVRFLIFHNVKFSG